MIAHVLMPDHPHLIAHPRDGDIKGFIGTLKGKLSMQIIELTGDRFLFSKPSTDGSTPQIWQESFKAVPLWSAWMIWQKINYIHANPVKGKFVNSAKDSNWSSFHAFYSRAEEPLAVGQDWRWPDDSMAFKCNKRTRLEDLSQSSIQGVRDIYNTTGVRFF